MQAKKTLIQLIKYGIIGVINTLITAILIWFLRKVGWNDVSANFVGYVAGLVNSFVWNRKWTFGSKAHWRRDLLLFFLVFALCYFIQLVFVLFLNVHTDHDPYYNHLIGIVVYSLLNFFLNKFVTFRKKSSRSFN